MCEGAKGGARTVAVLSLLTLDMCEGAEGGARAVAVLLYVVTPRRLVDLGVELLLGTRVTVRAAVAMFTVGRVAPLVRLLHVRARSRPGEGERGLAG